MTYRRQENPNFHIRKINLESLRQILAKDSCPNDRTTEANRNICNIYI